MHTQLLSLSLPLSRALHTTHTPRLSAFRKRREDETRVSLCPFAREFTAGLFAAKSNMESLTSGGVDPLLPQPGLTEVLFVEVTNQTAPPPRPPRFNPSNKDPSSPQKQEINKKSSARLHQVPGCFFLFLLFFWFLSPSSCPMAADLKLLDSVSTAKTKALCHGIEGRTRVSLHWTF